MDKPSIGGDSACHQHFHAPSLPPRTHTSMHGNIVCAHVTILTSQKHIDIMRPSAIAYEYSTRLGSSLGTHGSSMEGSDRKAARHVSTLTRSRNRIAARMQWHSLIENIQLPLSSPKILNAMNIALHGTYRHHRAQQYYQRYHRMSMAGLFTRPNHGVLTLVAS